MRLNKTDETISLIKDGWKKVTLVRNYHLSCDKCSERPNDIYWKNVSKIKAKYLCLKCYERDTAKSKLKF